MALLVGLAARAKVMGRRQELWRGGVERGDARGPKVMAVSSWKEA